MQRHTNHIGDQESITRTNKCSVPVSPARALTYADARRSLQTIVSKQVPTATRKSAKKAIAILVTAFPIAFGCSGQFSSANGRPVAAFLADELQKSQSRQDQKQHGIKNDASSMDAGIIFANEASYLCFPLSRFGIDQASSIKRVESSCNCVRPSLIHYVNERRQWIDAIRLDFVPEKNNTASEHQTSESSQLLIEVSLRLVNSEVKVITVYFLNAAKIEPWTGESER